MALKPKATFLPFSHFEPNTIRNLVDIRQTERHTIINNDGKSILMSQIVKNNCDKYPNNMNCNVFKFPILPDIIPYRSKNGWDFTSLNIEELIPNDRE